MVSREDAERAIETLRQYCSENLGASSLVEIHACGIFGFTYFDGRIRTSPAIVSDALDWAEQQRGAEHGG